MNEHMLRRQQMQRASREFLNALSSGQAHVVDRFGALIQQGGKLLYRFPVDPVGTVQAITPVLDPNVPPGFLDVTVTFTVPIRVQANQKSPALIAIGDAPAPTAPAETPGADVAPTDPPRPSETDASPSSPEDTVARLRAVSAQGDGDHGDPHDILDPRD